MGKLPLILVAALAVVAAYFAFPQEKEPPPAGPADPQKLVGKWARTDGDYLLDVRRVGEDGRAEVVYLNPRPINVSKAEVKVEGGAVRLFVELRDQGYPGSTYTLTLDSRLEALKGTYVQPAQGQRFDVAFVRTK